MSTISDENNHIFWLMAILITYILQLPIDLSKLSDEEKQELLMRRKAKDVKIVEDDVEDSFDPSQYSYLWK